MTATMVVAVDASNRGGDAGIRDWPFGGVAGDLEEEFRVLNGVKSKGSCDDGSSSSSD